MRDYTLRRPDGTSCEVADLPEPEILAEIENVANGFSDIVGPTSRENVLERLRIELVVRRIVL